MAERCIGDGIILNLWLPISPFYKKFVVLFANQLDGSKEHHKQLLELNPACGPDDPTAIIDEYLNPWWIKPVEEKVYVPAGLDRFGGQVRKFMANDTEYI